jgi:hypothetical protein
LIKDELERIWKEANQCILSCYFLGWIEQDPQNLRIVSVLEETGNATVADGSLQSSVVVKALYYKPEGRGFEI